MNRLARSLLLCFVCGVLLSLGRWVIVQGRSLTDPYQPVQSEQNPTLPLSYLSIDVNYAHSWVAGTTDAWETVVVTVTDNLGTLKADAVVTAEDSGDFFVACDDWFSGTCPDIVPGDLVDVYAAGVEKELLVGEISGTYDPTDNAITGRLNAGWVTSPTTVYCQVWANIAGAPMIITQADSNGGSFECDFDDVGWTLAPPQTLALRYFDDQGDSVINAINIGGSPWLKLSYISSTGGMQYFHDHPVVAYNWLQDEFLAGWQFTRYNTIYDQYEYYNFYKRFSDRKEIWNYPEMDTGIQPDLAYNGTDDEYLLVWKNENKIWGKIIDWQGYTIKDDFEIISWSTLTFDYPHVAWNSTANRYLVAWKASDEGSGRPSDISSMLISPDGDILIGRNLVISDEVGRLDLTYNPAANEFLVVFEYSDTPAGNGADIYGVRVSEWNDVISPGSFAIVAAAKDQRDPVVASQPAGGYLVAFEHHYEVDDIDIQAQALFNDGSSNGDIASIANSSINETQPAVSSAHLPAGSQYHILWRQEFSQGQAISGRTWPLPGIGMDIARWPYYDLGNPELVGYRAGSYIVFDSVPNSGDFPECNVYGFHWPPGVVYLPLVSR